MVVSMTIHPRYQYTLADLFQTDSSGLVYIDDWLKPFSFDAWPVPELSNPSNGTPNATPVYRFHPQKLLPHCVHSIRGGAS